jgi:hypothetical protein
VKITLSPALIVGLFFAKNLLKVMVDALHLLKSQRIGALNALIFHLYPPSRQIFANSFR